MKKGISIIEVIVIIAIITILSSLFGFQFQTAEGTHTGYITAVEKVGVFFKTYKAYIKTDLSSSQEEVYCVIDTDLVNKLKEVQSNKTKVTLHFAHGHFVPITQCEGTEQSVIRELQ